MDRIQSPAWWDESSAVPTVSSIPTQGQPQTGVWVLAALWEMLLVLFILVEMRRAQGQLRPHHSLCLHTAQGLLSSAKRHPLALGKASTGFSMGQNNLQNRISPQI